MYTRKQRTPTFDQQEQAFIFGNTRDNELLRSQVLSSAAQRTSRSTMLGDVDEENARTDNRPRRASILFQKHTRICAFLSVRGSLIGGPRDVKIHKESANIDGSTKNDERAWQEPGGELVRPRVQVADALGEGHVSSVYALVVRGNVVYSAARDASVKASSVSKSSKKQKRT
jgi:hypothetical protein